ncbi:uncharacterized protein NPIL_394011 [Nephila pilipes]|uniref:Uncharacterized protein n=1 Tax=Nephila pilipes TaxID=299642 RepID=A0A8X6UET3_NEPPI|nr:uncharacterized protein NPIL_394011 [Nephila pilipes]
MNKYADAQETEKFLNSKIEDYENKMKRWELKEEELTKNLTKYQGDLEVPKERALVNFSVTETQTSRDSLEEIYFENNPVTGVPLEGVKETSVSQNKINAIILDETNSILLNKTNETEEVGRNETSNNFKVFADSETPTFRAVTKRKLNLMDEDEVVTTPSKKPFLRKENNWATENQVHREFRPLIDDDKSFPSSFNSVDDIEQEKQVNEEFSGSVNVGTVAENGKSRRDGEVEINDLVNVELNLKDLKVCDIRPEKCESVKDM